jgi:hypothetical protein
MEDIENMHKNTMHLSTKLSDIVKSNKFKQNKLKEQNQRYNKLISSKQALELAKNVKYIRSTINNLEDFLVKEGVKGPKSHQ